MTQNVLDPDSASRILALMNRKHNVNSLPAILALFDFVAALPSVFQEFIILVLEMRKFQIGFIDFVKSLYSRNYGIFRQSGVECFLFWITSGVLQGCPASAFLFDVVLDPILEAFEEALGSGVEGALNPASYGIMRACADDIGAALLSLKGLRYLHQL